jgi:hypothetical protein
LNCPALDRPSANISRRVPVKIRKGGLRVGRPSWKYVHLATCFPSVWTFFHIRRRLRKPVL